jgi:acetolactate synthase-1/2/3 large subunit
MVRQWQKLFWNKRYSGTKLDADPDFVKIAESYGAWGIHVDKTSEIREALKRGIKSDTTCLIDIKVDPEADITPMILQDPKVPIVMGRCPYKV